MYYIRRILFIVPLILVISFLSFALMHVAPKGPFDQERKVPPEVERNLKLRYNLLDPMWKQYLRYLGVGWEIKPDRNWLKGGLIHGDFGPSFQKRDHTVSEEPYMRNLYAAWEKSMTGHMSWFKGGLIRGDFGPSFRKRDHTVSDIIAEGLPVSLTLGFLAFGFAMGLGLPVGFFSAVKRGQWEDYLGSFLALLAVCIPGLVIGPLLLVVFAIRLHWFPVGLWETPWHVVLPTAALGLYFAGKLARLMKEGMMGVMKSEFITAARAKGLGENALMLKHGLRMAILPVVSYSGPMLADLLTGSFVIESIFQVPGLGLLFTSGALNGDYFVVVGLVILYAALLLVLNLAVDLAYAVLDPRVKYE